MSSNINVIVVDSFCLLADSGTLHLVCPGERAHSSPLCPRISQHRQLTSSAKMYSTSCLICWTSKWILQTKQTLFSKCWNIHRLQWVTKEFVYRQLFFSVTHLLCFRSAVHSVQPIELNFRDSPTDGSAGNTIQISMDCITMHEPEETLTVST